MIAFHFQSLKGSLIAGALLTVLLLGGCTAQSREARYLKTGKKYLEKKDYPRAMLEFRNAERMMPEDAEPEYQVGIAYLGLRNKGAAFAAFSKAVTLNPKHAEAQVRLTELLATASTERFLHEAERWAKSALSLSPDNPDALSALALTEMKLGNQADAIRYLQQALDKFPQHLRSSVAMAIIELSRKNIKGAEEILKKAVALAPKSAEPSIALSEVYLMVGQAPEAEQSLKKALEIDPANSTALVYLARLQSESGHKDRAEQTYRRLSALPSKQFRPVHAVYLFQIGQADRGIRELETLYQQDPSDRRTRTYLVRGYIQMNRLADAQKLLSEVLSENAKDVDAMMQRGEIELRAGRLVEAQQDVHEVVSERPDSAEAHFLLSRIHRAYGAVLSQRQELAEALRLNPKAVAIRIELARSYTLSNSPGAALNLLAQAPPEQRQALPIVVERNWALLAESKLSELRHSIDQGLKIVRFHDLLLQDAILKSQGKDVSGARASLEEILAQDPEDLPALDILAQTYVEQKQPKAALEKIRFYAALRPRSAPLQHILGKYLQAYGQADQARAAFTAAKAADPHFAAADLSLAQLDRAAGRNDAARLRLDGLLASRSADRQSELAANLMLGDMEDKSGNRAAELKYWRKVVESDRSNMLALNNLAYVLLEYANQTEEALKYAQEAHELAPDNPDIEDTVGWAFYRKGIYGLAVEHLAHAVARDGTQTSPSSNVRKYHLAMAYFKNGDSRRGMTTLEAALKLAPDIPEAHMAESVMAESR